MMRKCIMAFFMKLLENYIVRIPGENFNVSTSVASGNLIFGATHILPFLSIFDPPAPIASSDFEYALSVTPNKVGQCQAFLIIEGKSRLLSRFCTRLGLDEIFSENFLLTEDEVSTILRAWFGLLNEILEIKCGKLYATMSEEEQLALEYSVMLELGSLEELKNPVKTLSTSGIRKLASDTESIEWFQEGASSVRASDDEILAEKICMVICSAQPVSVGVSPIVLVGKRRTEDEKGCGETYLPFLEDL